MSVLNIVRASLGALGQFSVGQQASANPSGGKRPAGHGERRKRKPVRPIWDRQRELEARAPTPQEIPGPRTKTRPPRAPLIVPRPDAGKAIEAQIIPWIMPDGRRVTPVYRNIATLKVTEQDDFATTFVFEPDTLEAQAEALAAGEARARFGDDVGYAQGFVRVGISLRDATPDQLLALGVHLGVDDDEEAIALLLLDDED